MAHSTKTALYLDVDGVLSSSYLLDYLDDRDLRNLLGKPKKEGEWPLYLSAAKELAHWAATGSSEGSRCSGPGDCCLGTCFCESPETKVTFPHELFANQAFQMAKEAHRHEGCVLQKVRECPWILYNPRVVSRVASILRSWEVEGFWCTSWREKAVQHLAPLFGFPAGMPDSLAGFRSLGQGVKVPAVKKVVEIRPLVWVDDEMSSFGVMEWLCQREGPTLAIQPKRHTGLLESHLDEMEEFCRDPKAYHAKHGVKIIDQYEVEDAEAKAVTEEEGPGAKKQKTSKS